MISVIIPAYNEEASIGPVLDELKNVVKAYGDTSEIIVVDDGSSDRTAEIAEQKNVIVIQNELNSGYGDSLKIGINSAKNEKIVIIDADGSYPVKTIPELVEKSNTYDMVVGARTKKTAQMSSLRKIPKFFLTRLASYLVRKQIPDINSGLRVFTKTFFKKYERILPSAFSFTMTITLSAITSRDKVLFIPIDYYKRKGKSKIRPFHDTAYFLFTILRTIVYFNPLRVFLPLGLFFIFSALVVSLYSLLFLGKLLDVTVVVLFSFGVQIISLGLIADLVNRKAQ